MRLVEVSIKYKCGNVIYPHVENILITINDIPHNAEYYKFSNDIVHKNDDHIIKREIYSSNRTNQYKYVYFKLVQINCKKIKEVINYMGSDLLDWKLSVSCPHKLSFMGAF